MIQETIQYLLWPSVQTPSQGLRRQCLPQSPSWQPPHKPGVKVVMRLCACKEMEASELLIDTQNYCAVVQTDVRSSAFEAHLVSKGDRTIIGASWCV
jgi:hypothetical protein